VGQLGRTNRVTGLLADVSAQLAIFLTVFGAKLYLIQQYTRPHPYWDSWHVEGLWFYKPFLSGNLALINLIEPASEHRPLVLRVYGIALLALNGQWDVQLQMVVNAALFALLGCLLFTLLAKELGTVGSVALAIVLTTLLSAPSGWENTLNGHHAGWYFFYLFSIAGIWLAVTRSPLSSSWCVGLVCLILSYLSLFAGVISIAVATGASGLRMVWERSAGRRAWVAVGLLGLTFVAGMALEPRYPGKNTIHASSVQAFFTALGYSLTWPHAEIAYYGFVLQLPAAILVLLLLLRKIPYSPTRGFVAALAAWVWLQAVGIAYARGMNGMPPVNRYQDILTLGLVVGFTSALVLLKNAPRRILRQLPALALVIAWGLSATAGLERRTRESFTSTLPEKRQDSITQEFNLRSFVATGNRGYLDHKPDRDIAYYGGANQVAAILTDPVLRPILPASIREPLPVRWSGRATDAPAPSAGRATANDLSDPDAFNTSTADPGGHPLHQVSDWIARPRFPILQFRVAGGLGRHGLSLQLGTESGALVPVRPTNVPLGGWATVNVRSPRERFRLVADDPSPNRWFAFSGPREMGRLSYYAEWLTQHAAMLSRVGYACGLVFLAFQGIMLAQRIGATRKGPA
jgi:hypothetical protein